MRKQQKKTKHILTAIRDWLHETYLILLGKKKHVRLGIYGAPNSGKTTLANRMCKDWLAEEVAKEKREEREKSTDIGKVSKVPHETKQIQAKDKIKVRIGRKTLSFTLIDTPGIATTVNYEDFMKHGMKKTKAKKWAREATRGVIEAIKALEEMDAAIILIDSSKEPLSQVNLTLIGNLDVRNAPFVIAANKSDLRRASPKKIEAAFPEYDVVAISAKDGTNMDAFYKLLYDAVS